MSGIVERVAAGETQSSLLADLGISRDLPPGKGGDTRKKSGSPDETLARCSVEALFKYFDEITGLVRDIQNRDEIRNGIHNLPLADPDPERLTLYKLKGLLEELFESEVVGFLKFVDASIESHLTGKPPKGIRKPKAKRKP